MKFDKNTKKVNIDFSESSSLIANNFNTPKLLQIISYLFLRTLVKDNIPLNEGALKNINLFS